MKETRESLVIEIEEITGEEFYHLARISKKEILCIRDLAKDAVTYRKLKEKVLRESA